MVGDDEATKWRLALNLEADVEACEDSSRGGLQPQRALLERIERDISEAYDFLVDHVRARFANGVLIVNTIYDPSDRTAKIPGVYDELGALPLDILDRMNDHMRSLAVGTPRVRLADVYARFLGHGVTAPQG